MTPTEVKYVEKLKDLIRNLDCLLPDMDTVYELKAEISALESELADLKQQLMECEGENITKDEFGYNDTEIPEKANNQTEIRECQYCPYNITGTTVGWYCKECGIKLGIT